MDVATRGQIPKRVNQKLGHNSKEENEVSTGALYLPEPIGPDAPEWMDGYALDLYEAFRVSGQAVYYTASDWAALALICRHVMATMRRPSAMMLAGILHGLSLLGATEGDRRRIKIELESGEKDKSTPEEREALGDIADFLGASVTRIH